MDVKGIKLTQRISKRDVNELLKDVIDIELVDDAYIGCKHKHNWRCLKCGYIFNRSFSLIKRGNYACKSCKRDIIKQKYQRIVDNIPDYELIDIYFKGDYTDNNILAKHGTLLKIKHNYCGEYLYLRCDTDTVSFYCKKCCGSYENSLAYYIEQELGEPLDKYWDFEKNTINPYHINRGSHDKIWIKCQEKDYHGSYIVACYEFSTYNQRCGYCWNFKTHPKDSFAQYHIDNTDKDFLGKY